MMPIISKLYCSSSQTVLVVRRRPHVVNGGGFVVTDCSTQRVVFRVDGCGIHGIKGELILRDGDGEALLLMRRKGGMVEALSIYKKWKGYSLDYEGLHNLVFSLKEPNSRLVRNNAIRISIEPRTISNKGWDFEIRGYFPDRNCSIVDTRGNVVAQVGVNKEVEKLMESKDFYHVVVKPGMDQAFVFGVIATLDYIYGESTYC
ncbi:protein LURP-one-related 6 [Gastrolobium bilobum]|uniref:protein LURP-one-related 6 n=1 Tax=Gastrolobium bilobum TaxID=150636 RepID=UPI002AB22644|nr:protein LURP-one-related 6 [Gastrolobium bilobum]